MKPRVFVSYSHRDAEMAARFVQHLRGFGDVDVWSDGRIASGDDWREQIREAVDTSSVAVLLLTVEFLASDFVRRTELPWLFARRDAGELRIVPVVVESCAWREVFGSIQVRDARGENAEARNDRFAEIAAEVRDLLVPAKPGPDWPPFRTQPDHVSTDHLPNTPYTIFGRDAEIAALDAAWREGVNVLTVVAPGGTGKTALLNHWLSRMAGRGYGGADMVFAWSFYVQGTRGEQVGSAGPFIHEALRFFGDPHPELGDPRDKAFRLVELIRKRRTLLLLDGMEPLQQRSERVEQAIGDEALHKVVVELAASNRGLCVITTRFPIADLQRFDGRVTTRSIDLGPLAPSAGADILAKHGVHGDRAELEAASAQLDGHSLAITLLAAYLVERFGGDVTRRHEIDTLLDGGQADHARRMLASYERILEPRERAVMQLVSLFDRPAPLAALRTVAHPPRIKRLTEPLLDVRRRWVFRQFEPMPETAWHDAVRRLRRLALLSGGGANVVDTHPIIRDYFEESLRRGNREGFDDAHERLFRYFEGVGKAEPDTERGMQHFYMALRHACEAGLHDLALREVYRDRVVRGEEFYSTRRLGMLSDDLAALARFFERPWDVPVRGLAQDSRAFVLHQAGWMLMALARLSEAKTALVAASAEYARWLEYETRVIRLRDRPWRSTPPLARASPAERLETAAAYGAVAASNLSQLHLVMGDFADALRHGQESLRLAEAGRSRRWLIGARSDVADVLRHMGRPGEALALLKEADALAGADETRLYSFPGYRYWDLLLELGHIDEAEERARQGLELAHTEKGLGWLDVGLAHLLLGRAAIARANGSEVTLRQARRSIESATDAIRKAGRRDHLPRALTAFGEVCTLLGEFEAAARALDEALAIAEAAGMRTFEADARIGHARLALARGAAGEAAEHAAEAKKIVDAIGYRRRDGDLAALGV